MSSAVASGEFVLPRRELTCFPIEEICELSCASAVASDRLLVLHERVRVQVRDERGLGRRPADGRDGHHVGLAHFGGRYRWRAVQPVPDGLLNRCTSDQLQFSLHVRLGDRLLHDGEPAGVDGGLYQQLGGRRILLVRGQGERQAGRHA